MIFICCLLFLLTLSPFILDLRVYSLVQPLRRENGNILLLHELLSCSRRHDSFIRLAVICARQAHVKARVCVCVCLLCVDCVTRSG